MFQECRAKIYNQLPSTKVNGVTIPATPTYVKDVDCDIQPYSTTLFLKQYGYNIEVNKRIFMDFEPSVTIGTIFYYTNPQNILEKYEVKAIVNWDYLEVMCLGIS